MPEKKAIVEEPTPETIEEKTPEQPSEEFVQLQAQLQKLEESYKNEQRVSSKKEQEIQQLQDRLDGLTSDREITQALIAQMATQQGRTEEEFGEEIKAKKPDLLAQYQQVIQRQEQTRVQKKVNAFQERVEALGLTSKDEDYQDIRAFVETLKFDRADAKLRKLEAVKAPKEEKAEVSKETEEERVERLAEEKARKMLEDRGLLTTETGGPSAGSTTYTVEQLKKMQTTPEGLKEFEKNRDKIFEAMLKGQIK